MTQRPAIFLDRDGTLTLPRHYPRHPAELVLRPGIGPPLRRAPDLGYALVVVTNQSGMTRGLFTQPDLDRMHDHLRHLLRDIGVQLDAIYVCPHHPDGHVPHLAIACGCRKPRPGMLLQAAHDLNIDLANSWMIGDASTDIDAGNAALHRMAMIQMRVHPGAKALVERCSAAATQA